MRHTIQKKFRAGALAAALVLLMGLLVGCGADTVPESSQEPSSSWTASTQETHSTGVDSSIPPTTAPDPSEEDQTSSPTKKPTSAPTKGKTTTTTTTTTTKKPTTTATTLPRTVRVTIPEGKSLVEIFQILDKNHVASFDDLMKTAATYDYSYYPLVAAIPNNASRCYKLEGYLFPDTYEFYTNSKPQDAIGKFLRQGEAVISPFEAQAKQQGMTMDEVLIITSLIQEEGSKASEMTKISAVIHNRLEQGMKLQLDATKNYVENWIKPYISGDKDRYSAAYNTYKCAALPAGPICNPGKQAIQAALNPADVDYLYFCTETGKDNPQYFYAATYEEHLENLKKAGITLP